MISRRVSDEPPELGLGLQAASVPAAAIATAIDAATFRQFRTPCPFPNTPAIPALRLVKRRPALSSCRAP